MKLNERRNDYWPIGSREEEGRRFAGEALKERNTCGNSRSSCTAWTSRSDFVGLYRALGETERNQCIPGGKG